MTSLIEKYIEQGRPIELRNQIAEDNKKLIYTGLKHRNLTINRSEEDMKDLEQEAYIHLLNTIEIYDPSRGSLSTLYYLSLPNIVRNLYDFREIVEAKRYRKLSKDRDKPIHFSISSLEAPATGTDDLILADTIEDEQAQESYLQAEIELDREQIRETIRQGLKDEELIDTLFSYYGIATKQKTTEELAEIKGISTKGIHKRLTKAKYLLYHHPKLKKLAMDYIDISLTPKIDYDRVGKSYGISNPTERIALKRLKIEEEIKNYWQ